MNVKSLFTLTKETFSEWSEDRASRLAAALAYYTIFSLVPLLVIIISLAGLLGGGSAAENQILFQMQNLVGQQGRSFFQDLITNASKPSTGIIATIIGSVTLLIGALGVFGELQESLNTIWEVKIKPAGSIWETIKRVIFTRLISFTMILGVGFLLLVSLVVSAGLASVQQFISYMLPLPDFVLTILNFSISFLLITLLFAMIYKILPDADIAWRDVWLGAAVTSLLFTLGKFVIAQYLGRSTIQSSFGAAGTLALLLVWVYYSAQILFLGAEFTQVYANKYGSRIVPDENAQPVSEEARANQGMDRKGQPGPAPAGRPGEPAMLPGTGQAPVQTDPSFSGPVETQPVLAMRRRVLALPPPPDRALVKEIGVPMILAWVGAVVVGTLVHFSFIKGKK
jgi:membrane protein